MRRTRLVLLSVIGCLVVGSAAAAGRTGHSSDKTAALNFTFTGSPGAAVLVHPGFHSGMAAQLTTTGNGSGELGTWGAVDVAIPNDLTLSQVSWLSTEYRFTLGSCWGGSPRFELWIPDPTSSTGHVKIFLYIGPPPSWVGCPAGQWLNTGNLATADGYVDDSQLPGGSESDTWAHAQELYGSDAVSAVYVDADGGWKGEQVLELDDTQVDSTLVTYETH